MNARAVHETHRVDRATEGVDLLIGIPDQNLRRSLLHQDIDTSRSQILENKGKENSKIWYLISQETFFPANTHSNLPIKI